MIERHRTRTLWVIALTASMMGVELVFGTLSGSMALLADGWHMATHVGALGITYMAYQLSRSKTLSAKLSFGPGKVIPLGGYTSAIGLALAAVWMAVESIERLIHPIPIQYAEALIVTMVGLLINIISAVILGRGNDFHGDDFGHSHTHGTPDHHHHHDHNLKSAYFHVLADALTSVLAIVALALGKVFNFPQADAVVGVVGAGIILKWAYGLCRETALELLDQNLRSQFEARIREALIPHRGEILELRVWRTGPGMPLCQIRVRAQTVEASQIRESLDPDRWQHLSIEVCR